MKCPRCRKPLVILELNKVEIDHCLECGGVWLDTGELELLIGSPIEICFEPAEKTGKRRNRCSRCGQKMDRVSQGGLDGVVLDRCKRGHGLWFDSGELEVVLQHERSGVDNRILEQLRGIFRKKAANRGEAR